ncbi:hypothetical protein O1L68_07730 [Streptomyces lydicus]|nr:hypothetical protein [Streptomyces lydicus]
MATLHRPATSYRPHRPYLPYAPHIPRLPRLAPPRTRPPIGRRPPAPSPVTSRCRSAPWERRCW